MSEGNNIVTHIGKLCKMNEQLPYIGKKVSNTCFVMALLGSLLESIRISIVTLGTRLLAKQTSQMVTIQLLQYVESIFKAKLTRENKFMTYFYTHNHARRSQN